MSLPWHPWQPVPPLPHAAAFTPSSLGELLDGGQAFRWTALPESAFEGQWGEHHVRVRLAPNASGTLEFAAPLHADPAATAAALHFYLSGPPAAPDALPWRSDAHLAAAMAAFPGLRILRQPFGETLLGFVCSATKQIPQIKQMQALLATRHGRALNPVPSALQTPNRPPQTTSQSLIDNIVFHRLPTWTELAAVSESELRACSLGFRARHVAAIARFLAENPGWLEATEHAPYSEAKASLITLQGVGEKVADCVLLFGAGRLEAFPVDTWILKALARRYDLAGWKPAQVAHFGRTHFGPQAGLAQQYLFAYERAAARGKLTSP
jgi:N-glycosylase/DNA lyase